MIRGIEQTTMRKVYLRVLPIAALSYFLTRKVAVESIGTRRPRQGVTFASQKPA
jgi:hypothetical protein